MSSGCIRSTGQAIHEKSLRLHLGPSRQEKSFASQQQQQQQQHTVRRKLASPNVHTNDFVSLELPKLIFSKA